jgi:hypothetical protein
MTPKSWANEEIINHWLSRVWRRNNQTRRLLVWDSFSAHITPLVKNNVGIQYNTDMAVIPGGCTSKLQPLDVSLNKPFKSFFRGLYDDWLIEGPIELTKGGNRKAPSTEVLLKWIKKAWDSISPDMVRKSFVKCGISSAMDGSEDHLIFEDDNDEDPFEGFGEDEIKEIEEIEANQANIIPAMLLDDSTTDVSNSSESEDDYNHPDSPGH